MAWAACAWATALAIRKWKLTFRLSGVLWGVVLLAPYIILAVKFGNVQPYLIVLVLVALLADVVSPGSRPEAVSRRPLSAAPYNATL